MNDKSIAVFDSGVGGLTVLREILKVLPNENIIYFGDTARVPYGPRSKDEIIEFTMNIVDFLKTKDIKTIVIACNTITSLALDSVRNHVDIPVIGVIEPGARMALNKTKNGKVGIIATEGTINSNVYQNKIENANSKNKALGIPCPEFVTIAEENPENYGIEKVKEITKNYISKFNDFNFDTLILGCTHFPVLQDFISDNLKEDVQIINPAYETTKELVSILKKEGTLNNVSSSGIVEFYVSKDKNSFRKTGENILNTLISNINEVQI